MPAPAAASASRSGLLLALFFVTMLLPINMELAGLRLYPVRIFLLILFVPLLFGLVTGRGGRLTSPDGFMIAYVLWMVLTLVFHHGMERFAFSGILAVETLGGYMLGRILIRNVADYRRFIGYFLLALLVILPLGIYELFTSRIFLSDLLSGFFSVTNKNYAYRFGLSRVQVAFPHSILYGLFCSMALANVFYLYRDSITRLVPRMGLVLATTSMSLSSGPLLSMMLQLIMITWDRLMGGRWKLFLTLVGSMYVFLELFTSRGAVVFLINRLTFSPESAWYRIHIWRHGSASVLNHPLMGIGLNDWVRPSWLSASVDNFWLLIAMRHGLPAILFLMAAIAIHIYFIVKSDTPSPAVKDVRTGYMITLSGILFTLATVFIWNEVAIFVMFYIGAGSFLYTSAPEAPDVGPGDLAEMSAPASRRLPLSRFPRRDGPMQPSPPPGRRAIGPARPSLSGHSRR